MGDVQPIAVALKVQAGFGAPPPPPPPPDGTCQLPSPRQNVVFEAPVPPLRLATGRLPTAWFTGMLVMFDALPLAGVPNAGVVIVQPVVIQNGPDPLIPVHAHVDTLLPPGAPNSMTLLALGDAFGGVPNQGVVSVVGPIQPHEFAVVV